MAMFGRIGLKQNVNNVAKECKANGAKIIKAAGTVEATWNGQTLFKAIQKNSVTWMIMYNDEFFPNPMAVNKA